MQIHTLIEAEVEGLKTDKFFDTTEFKNTSPNFISGVQTNGAKINRGIASSNLSSFCETVCRTGGEITIYKCNIFSLIRNSSMYKWKDMNKILKEEMSLVTII